MMIDSNALVEKFRYALENHWGYIWGTAGIGWTEARQKQKVNYMVSKYGENWKKNSDAKADDYYSAALYGSKWIGHTVADCSGLFRWSFKQLGSDIAHGSNSIWSRYCKAKGRLSGGKRTDGKPLLPGTAVFTGTDATKPHIGLYCGDGKVIEASGTQAGVVTSNINATKWKYWGELKEVEYHAPDGDSAPSAPSEDETPMTNYPTLKKGNKGEYVRILQQKLKDLGYDLGSYGVDGDFGSATLAAVKTFQRAMGLAVDGIVGKNTWEALEKADSTPVMYYFVKVSHLTESQAKALCEMYDHAEMGRE